MIVYLFALTLQQTRYISKYAATFTEILIYNLMKIPYSTYQTLPISVTCATILVMILMVKNNELLIYLSSGGKLILLSLPFFATGVILSILMLFLGDYVNPMIEYERSKYKKEMIENKKYYSIGKIDNIWIKEKDQKFVHIGLIDPINKTATDIKEYYIDSSFKPYKLVSIGKAKRSDKIWDYYGYEEYDIRDIPVLNSRIDMKSDFNHTLDELIKIPNDNPKLLRMRDLLRIISFYDRRGINTNKYRLIFYSKISQSLSVIILILLILPISVNFSRQHSYILIASKGIGIGFIYWFIVSSFYSLGKTGVFGPFIAVFLPLFSLLILSVVMIFKREKGM